jgi:hypothetical protein
MPPILEYHPGTIEALRHSHRTHSIQDDAASTSHLSVQIDAADRAYLRAGIHKDGNHRSQTKGFHPMLHALRDNTKSRGDRKAWIQVIKDDMWDAVCSRTLFIILILSLCCP